MTFVNLQYGDTGDELDRLHAATGIKVVNEPLTDPLTDLDGHLAQVAAMDLVISTSNTTVHAAGAQDIPVWCLVPKVLGEGLRWMWFAGREDSPWYKSLRFYRQIQQGDWGVPIGHAATDLVGWSAARLPAFDATKRLKQLAMAFQKSGQTVPMGMAVKAALAAGTNSVAMSRIAAKSERAGGFIESSTTLLNTALKSHESNVDLLVDRASSLVLEGRIDGAIADLRHAIKLVPENPAALHNLAKALRLKGRLNEALDVMKRAKDQAQDQTLEQASIHLGLGTFLLELGRPEEAITVFDALLKRDPSNIDAASSRAIAMLASGNLSGGWFAYRKRLAQASANVRYDSFPQPVWNGESIDSAHVLVWTEQGVGEEILVATLIPELARKARAVTLLCSNRMVPVFRRSFPTVAVAERNEPLPDVALNPDIDFQMSLSDLGATLRPSIESFPVDKNETVLKADPLSTDALRARYTANANGQPIIGLSWQSQTPDIGRLKSLDPMLAEELIAQTNATFVCLQYAPSEDHLSLFSKAGKERWIHDETVDPLKDMDRAAAQVAALDFVITVSNSTVHVSGALGIPTALLVPQATGRHWYWFRNQKYSAWYPSVRLYETHHEHSWQDAITELVEDLAALVVRS